MRRTRGGRAKSKKGRLRLPVLIAAAVFCGGVLLVCAWQVAATLGGRMAARQEYAALRQDFAPAQPAESGAAMAAQSGEAAPKPLAEVNPDYVGWLAVPGAGVDYPVARGADNVRYLNTTFEGSANAAGAIFMDCGNTDGFSSRHTILYGHSVKDGSMFGGLHRYLDAAYLAQHPDVTVTLPDGSTQAYHIFAARQTDAWDAAYRLAFAGDEDFAAFAAGLGAPPGTARLLTLSTCTNGGDDSGRVLVHAALAA